MTSQTTTKFSPEVQERAVRMLLEHEGANRRPWNAGRKLGAKRASKPQQVSDRPPDAVPDGGCRSAILIALVVRHVQARPVQSDGSELTQE